jgi:NADH-quinone oxidoreductase subunit K
MTPAMPANIQVTLALAIILFAIGMVGFLTRRNMILMFLSTELMFQAAALAFVAFGRMWMDLSGQLMVIFILTVAAAEAAVALGRPGGAPVPPQGNAQQRGVGRPEGIVLPQSRTALHRTAFTRTDPIDSPPPRMAHKADGPHGTSTPLDTRARPR